MGEKRKISYSNSASDRPQPPAKEEKVEEIYNPLKYKGVQLTESPNQTRQETDIALGIDEVPSAYISEEMQVLEYAQKLIREAKSAPKELGGFDLPWPEAIQRAKEYFWRRRQ